MTRDELGMAVADQLRAQRDFQDAALEAVEVLEGLYETAELARDEWHQMYCMESDSHTKHGQRGKATAEAYKLTAENNKLRFDLEEASVLLTSAALVARRTIPELKKSLGIDGEPAV
jgi:hypothetical protein